MMKSMRIWPGLLFAVAAVGQTPTFSQLYNFPMTVTNTTTGAGYWPQGHSPQGPLLQASDGNFYGTTNSSGDNAQCFGYSLGNPQCGGTIFQLTPAGKLTVLHTFILGTTATPATDGDMPNGGLVEGPDGYLYGSTIGGGLGNGTGAGVIFRISKTGTFQNLQSFCATANCTEGFTPSPLVLGLDGKFYGTTLTSLESGVKGTIFRISASGVLETLHKFAGIPDGGAPTAGLIQGSDCNFYGVASGGGANANSSGTVFRMTPGGVYTVLYSFDLQSSGLAHSNGTEPDWRLVQASNGKLYGSTNRGGANGFGIVFEVGLDGTFRKVVDLNRPSSVGGLFTLIQASDGNLWGTNAGVVPQSTLYTINIASGSVQTVAIPCSLSGMGVVSGSLIQGKDGKLYGVGLPGICASDTNTSGSIFSVDAGLPKLPNPVVSAVTNGASFAAGVLVPGEIATVFGTSLTSSTGINLTSSLPLPDSFLNSTVLVNGCPATPLFAVDNVNGQQQINFQSPWEIAGQQVVAVQVANNGGISPPVDITVSAAQPGIINYSSGSNVFGAILHSDYSLVTPASPAKADDTVLIYGTGLGAVSTPQVDGTAANGESTVALPTVTIGGASAIVTFSGLAPGFVGLNQVNVVVPSGLSAGNQPVIMTLGGVTSNSVLLPIIVSVQ